jgi:glycosyltransferase involved in cell wall biosynthesis
MNEKTKVLWFSNRTIDGQDYGKSGTWLISLAPELIRSRNIKLANISVGSVKDVVRNDYGEITQWMVPPEIRNKHGFPSHKTIEGIKRAIDTFSPDIIHIWGTEGYWGLLSAHGYIKGKCLLSIQGLITSILPVFYGGLTNRELIKCMGLREFLKPRGSLFAVRDYFMKRSIWENEIIKCHNDITVQSEWIETYIKATNPLARIYKTERVLRKEFLDERHWLNVNKSHLGRRIIFTISTGYPYKGLHVLIRSLKLIRSQFPDVVLNIGGYFLTSGIKQSGYERWITNLISELDLNMAVNFLGPLKADDIVKNLLSASVFVNPSFVESYSVSLAEALKKGTPSVVSFSGAMPELAISEDQALFFSPGDHLGCARQIMRLLDNHGLSQTLSKNASESISIRSQTSVILENQIKTYKSVLKNLYK